VKEEKGCGNENKVKLLANGSCIWYREFQVSVTHCPMDVKWFPFDEQRCELKFESKTRESKELNVSAVPPGVMGVDAMYETNGVWELIGKANCAYSLCSSKNVEIGKKTASHMQHRMHISWD